jgi:hypothetical protein
MKNIQPLNEAAVREARDSNTEAGVTPKINIHAIYHDPEKGRAAPRSSQPGAPAPGSAPRSPAAPVAPGQPGATAPATPAPGQDKNPGKKLRIAAREQAMQLYAIVYILYNGLLIATALYGIYRIFHVEYGLSVVAPQITYLALFLLVTPVTTALACAFLLLTRSLVLAKAALILMGLFQFAIIAQGVQALSAAFTFTRFATVAVGIFFLVWTYTVFKDISLLDDSPTVP